MRAALGKLIAGFLISVSGAATPAFADSFLSELKAGQSYSTEIKLPFFNVPLPPGDWILTSADEQFNNNRNVVLDIALARKSGTRLTEYITLSTNVDSTRGGWYISRDCERKDILYVVKIANYENQQDCRGVNHIILDQTSQYSPKVGVNIRKYAIQNNIEFPHTALTGGIRFADRSRYLSVYRYMGTAALGYVNDPPTT